MKIKQKPEDFSVKESWRFDEVPGGRHRVYLMDKQKLSTFEAVERIRQRFGLRPGSISFCGLKDKQGRTEQLIAVDGADVDLQDPDLRLKFLGNTDRPLSAANTTSNRFSVTVRALNDDDLRLLNLSAAEVARLGVVNYFDSQRFGSLKHGQGFIAKDLIRGDFEAALKNYMAKPSPLDKTEDAKVKAFWRDNWGQWLRKPPYKGNAKYYRILRVLREEPRNFVKAFLQIDANYRALLLFEYQSYLWNEGVRRLMQTLLPREALFPAPYQAGTLLFHRDAPAEVLRYLREATFPLLAPDTEISDPRIKAAVDWVLGKEKITLEQLRIEEAPKMLYFKHEERPVLVYPGKLVLGRTSRDELNRGFMKLNVAFTLPPGSYATLVIRRLFHFSWEETSRQELEARTLEALRGGKVPGTSEGTTEEEKRPTRKVPGTISQPVESRERAPVREAAPLRAAPTERKRRAKVEAEVEVEPKAQTAPLGFRDRQKIKKAKRAEARVRAEAKARPPRKPAKTKGKSTRKR